MDNLWNLFKTTLIDNYNINKWFSKDKSNILKMIGKLLLLLIVMGYLVGTVVLYTRIGVDYLSKYNAAYLVISMFMVAAVFSIFTLSIFKAKSTIFSKKDTDMLFSMPIKPRVIFANKVINFLLNNYLIVIFMLLPVILTYGIMLKMSMLYYIFSIIVILFLPIIPTILSSIFGYFIAIASSKSKKKSIVEIVFTFGIVIFLMAISFLAQVLIEKFVNNIDTINQIIKTVGYPIYLMQEAIINQDILSLVIYLGISIVLFLGFIIILSKNYIRISLKLQENVTKGKYKEKKLVTSSVSQTLFKKELKTYFSIPVYIVNTAFGVIMLLCLAIASLLYNKEQIISVLELGEISNNMYMVVLVIFAFIISMTSTTSSSISLEGKNIDILKSLPVSPKQIFNSKLYLNLLILIPISVICAIIFGISMGITILQIISVIAVILFMSIVVSQLGLIMNLLCPKLNFKSPVQVVKQGMSMFVTMMGMFAIDVLFIMTYYFVSNFIPLDIYVYIIIAILLIAIIVQNMILNKWGQKKFKELSY